MTETEELNEVMNNDFCDLTENNQKKILDMTKFLVITQNNIVPSMLKEKRAMTKNKVVETEKQGSE